MTDARRYCRPSLTLQQTFTVRRQSAAREVSARRCVRRPDSAAEGALSSGGGEALYLWTWPGAPGRMRHPETGEALRPWTWQHGEKSARALVVGEPVGDNSGETTAIVETFLDSEPGTAAAENSPGPSGKDTYGTRRGMEQVRRGRRRGPGGTGRRIHRLHLPKQDRARMRGIRHPPGRGAWLPPAGRGHARRACACGWRQGVGGRARQGAHSGAGRLAAVRCRHEHPGRAHRQPAPRPQAEPAVRVERVHAVRYALLRRHQELPVGHAAAGAARRDREERRHRGGRPGGRRPGRSGVLRHRPAGPPGRQADGEEGQRGGGGRGPGPVSYTHLCPASARLPPKPPSTTTR